MYLTVRAITREREREREILEHASLAVNANALSSLALWFPEALSKLRRTAFQTATDDDVPLAGVSRQEREPVSSRSFVKEGKGGGGEILLS